MSRPETPLLTVDLIIEQAEASEARILLIERRNEPLGWALPGGFVDRGETVTQAALREACEETALEPRLRCLLGVYSDPQRDPRGHTVSVVFIAAAAGEPQAGDDAAALRWVDPAAPPALAFDHALILSDYLRWRRTGEPAPLR